VKKQTKSSTKSVKAIPAQRIAPMKHSVSLETQQHMRECEARDWMKRRLQKIGELGSEAAQLWWAGVKNDIDKRRGVGASAELVKRMEVERAKRNSSTVAPKR